MSTTPPSIINGFQWLVELSYTPPSIINGFQWLVQLSYTKFLVERNTQDKQILVKNTNDAVNRLSGSESDFRTDLTNQQKNVKSDKSDKFYLFLFFRLLVLI